MSSLPDNGFAELELVIEQGCSSGVYGTKGTKGSLFWCTVISCEGVVVCFQCLEKNLLTICHQQFPLTDFGPVGFAISWVIFIHWWREVEGISFFFWSLRFTLQETNISPKNGILKMIFLFPRWDMLIPWRVSLSISSYLSGLSILIFGWSSMVDSGRSFSTSLKTNHFSVTQVTVLAPWTKLCLELLA